MKWDATLTSDDAALTRLGVKPDSDIRSAVLAAFESEVDGELVAGGGVHVDRWDGLWWWGLTLAPNEWFVDGKAPGRDEFALQPSVLNQRRRALAGQDPSPIYTKGVRGVGAVEADPRGLADHR